jgi:CRISPR/Cas system CSM-associated protein Csm3 (group 7 of RAMP superfamily)
VMARQSYEPAAPKPYGFVRVDPLRDEDREHPAGHHRYKDGAVSGTLRGEIHVLSPVHVASGTLEMQADPESPLYKAHVRSGGRVVIPGSTLKGAVRSVVEAISASCVRITRVRRDQLPRGAEGCRSEKKLCVACRMFGSLGYQGQVRFTDALLRQEYRTALTYMPSLYAPRTRAGGVYVERGQIKGRKFYHHGQPAMGNVPVEVCPTGSDLDFTLHFDNLAPAEVGLLLTALGLGDPPLVLKLGGGKPTCYGSMRVNLSGLEIFENMRTAYADYDLSKAASSDPADYLSAARELIRSKQLRELAELLKVDTGRQCPDGNY